jgi:hypothetical protein
MERTMTQTDYLAIIPIGGGSSWGRAPDREKAIEHAIKSLRDWDHLFAVANTEVTLNVVDVSPHDSVWWDNRGLHYKDADGFTRDLDRPIEVVKRTTPKWKRRK